MKRKIVYFSFSKKCKQRSGPFTFINHLYSLHFSSSLAKWHQCPTLILSTNGVRKTNEASSDKCLWLHVSPINIRVTNYESTPHLLALITEKPTINRTSFIKVFSSRNLFKLLGGKIWSNSIKIITVTWEKHFISKPFLDKSFSPLLLPQLSAKLVLCCLWTLKNSL